MHTMLKAWAKPFFFSFENNINPNCIVKNLNQTKLLLVYTLRILNTLACI